MLRPIPKQLLRHLAVIHVCKSVDSWQSVDWEDTEVQNVHIQPTNSIVKTATNTEVVLRSILFIDSFRSTPHLAYNDLMEKSLAAGAPMRATVYAKDGTEIGDYEVVTVEPIPDYPSDNVHHYELGLI